ncbi:hypothetical protein TIFTF001_022527 [Ficus carica]|uniref:Uncharacterized protein n=1 Tax=Ficus carica TaxID=3494 RepID=A0AA88AIT6_FICCA|nr:hypothetical protein TIFTF001_022527 [Ficus carica]
MSPSSLLASESSRNSSFNSFSTSDMNNETEKDSMLSFSNNNENVERLHLWDCPSSQETGSFLEGNKDEYYEKERDGFVGGIFSKLRGFTPSRAGGIGRKIGLRSVSDVGKVVKKKFNRQF